MLSISHLFEYDVLQFSKRAYTDKYPTIAIPTNMSKPAIRNVITHLQGVLSQPASTVGDKSEADKDADKFDGTNADYDEKTNIS